MKHITVIIISILLLFTGCRKQPEGVLSDKEMENLLVDIHKTEAVITLNHNRYPSDDKKRAMREAVFIRHNTTQEQFDYSLEWYGKNINLYMNIYDKVIERLKKENEEVKKLIALEDAQILTQAGDSVDIWKQQRYHIFNADKAENILSFSINTDENFKQNDRFVLRFHVINTPHNGAKAHAYIAIRHNRQKIHYNFADVSNDGWNTLTIQSDTASNLSELYGYIAMSPRKDHHIMYIDSIELVRIHDNTGKVKYDYKVLDVTTEHKGKRSQVNKKEKEKSKKKNVFKRINKQDLKNLE